MKRIFLSKIEEKICPLPGVEARPVNVASSMVDVSSFSPFGLLNTSRASATTCIVGWLLNTSLASPINCIVHCETFTVGIDGSILSNLVLAK